MAAWLASANSLAAIATAALGALFVVSPAAIEPRVCHSNGLATKKATAAEEAEDAAVPKPLLATLVQTHTDERVPLDVTSPSDPRFDALLADRVTGSSITLDPRLLALLRTMAAKYGAPDQSVPVIELVSGFRSPKLNEMMRKKGHHVASHSQHSLGRAVDFRVLLPCTGARTPSAECAAAPGATAIALDPRVVERAIRATGWDGGTGIYTLTDDWFVHADVGPNRTWFEGPTGADSADRKGLPRFPGP